MSAKGHTAKSLKFTTIKMQHNWCDPMPRKNDYESEEPFLLSSPEDVISSNDQFCNEGRGSNFVLNPRSKRSYLQYFIACTSGANHGDASFKRQERPLPLLNLDERDSTSEHGRTQGSRKSIFQEVKLMPRFGNTPFDDHAHFHIKERSNIEENPHVGDFSSSTSGMSLETPPPSKEKEMSFLPPPVKYEPIFFWWLLV